MKKLMTNLQNYKSQHILNYFSALRIYFEILGDKFSSSSQLKKI